MADKIDRRTFLAGSGALLALPAAARAADPPSSNWPSKPIRVVMPFGAGGSMDILSRLLAPLVSEQLGQQVVVENRAGATGTVAMAAVASAPPDGYTLMFTGSSYPIVSLLMPNLPFTMDAFTPLSRLTIGPTILCVPSSLGIKTLAEFVAAAKARPGKWSYGSSGIGTSVHLGGEMIKMDAGIDLAHVPYKATPAIVADLIEGRLQMSVLGVTDVRQYITSGQVRGLALSHTERMPEFPDIPTFAEAGYPKVRASNDFGISIRSATPAPIRARLEEAYRTAVRRPEIVKRLTEIGLIVVGTSSAEFEKVLAEDAARYTEVIRVANVRLE